MIKMIRNLYALLIGIDRYPHPGDRLNGCVNDIAAIEKFIKNRLHKKYNPHIEKLIDEQATRQAVVGKFESHLCRAGKDDVVLFYFCGHGSQELAGLEFDTLEYEKELGKKKLETIVCYDSRTISKDGTQIRDLADKELRYLIAKVAKNEPHILVVFDCCHSSSGTRETDRKERVRRLSTDTRLPRAYNEFCFAGDSQIAQGLKKGQFPEGKHVFMSACLYTETAKEMTDSDGNTRGVFSYFLLKELNSLNATLSYNDLLNEVKGHVHGRRRDQTPQVEPIGMSYQEDLNSIAFLGDREVIKPREPYFNLIYRHEIQDCQSAEWIVTGGISQFLQEDCELAVYPNNCTFDAMKDKSRKLGDVRITAVRMEESAVTFFSEAELPKDSDYKAVLIKRPLSPVRFYLEGDATALAQVEEKLTDSLVVGIERDRSKPHQYRLYAREQRFEITDTSDRLLVVPIEANGEYDVNKAVKQVEHIARWTKIRQLENPNSSIPKNAIEIEITHNGKVYTNSELQIEHGASIRLKLKNTLEQQLDQPLYCAILDVADDYSVGILKVFPEGGDRTWICLNPGQAYQAQRRSGVNWSEDIPFGMPKEVINQGLTEYQDVLKLIVSTEAFTTLSQFEQNSLLRADQKSRQMLTDPPVADWMTKQITLTTVRADSVELTPQTETVLSPGVCVMTPPELQASARLKTPSSTSRSLSSMALPALLDHTEAFQFSTSRSVRQDASVLELEVNPSTLDAVKPDSPMIISVDRPLQPNERVLAVAHDGQFYLPLGVGQAEKGKTEIKIERLCDSQRLNADERELRQAIQLCFCKVVLDNVGQTSSYAWLRQATLNGDGTVSYTDKEDVDTVKTAVAKANNIVLYIHGIIGDTESMIPSGRYAKVNANGQVKSLEELYDLVLAFDYESLNTSIEDTARELKRQLAAVGLEPQHGKTLHILAHSMGGLVSRRFIEHHGENEVVSHLIMVGTPNGGSPWATVHDLATTLLSFGLNLSLVPLVPSLLEKSVEAMSVTLREMHATKSSFLDELKASSGSKCPYSIIAGSTALMDQASEVKQLLDVLKSKMRRAVELPFGEEENDIAVAVSSMVDVPQDGSFTVNVLDTIACDHLSYFRRKEGLYAIANAVARAFGYPPEPLPPSGSSSPPKPKPNPSPVSSGKTGTQPTSKASRNTPTKNTPHSSTSTDQNSAVFTNGSQMPPSSSPESTLASPQSNSNHETRTTKWFDTTYVVAIGIDDYKPPIELDNAVNDANRIYDLLDKESLRSGEKIERYKLLNQDATFDGIRQQLKTLKTKVKENDRLIFYYAGHGIALHSQESTESDLKQNPAQGESKQTPKNKPRGYLIPYDADMEGRKNYLSMDDLLDWLGDIQCRHGLIILDCCYAGSIQWSLDKTRQMLVEKIYPSVLDNYISKQAWFILTSSDENEKANDGMPTDLKPEEQLTKKTRNSPFVRCLHEALVDSKADMYPKDGDKIITTAELETYLSEVTNRTSQFNGEESRQTPQRFKLTGKHQGGEFVFLLNDFETIKTQLPKDPDVTADDKHNPYRGLNSFTEDHKDCFFGRERVTEKLFNHVCDHRLTVVLGTSGVGKSSLVNAGLIPKLKETSQEAESSQSSNAEAKTTRPPNSEPKSPQVEWNHERFRPGQSPAKALEEALNKLEAKNSPENTKRLLVIDQFEEVETQCRDDNEKRKFWNTLIKKLKNASETFHIVLTLRSDFEAIVRGKFESAIKEKNTDYEFGLDWVGAKFVVPEMEREELQEAIEKPAQEKAVFFTSEPDPKKGIQRSLVQQLVHEVAGMPGALPLLSFALYSMYLNFAGRYVKSNKTIKREITWEDYHKLGGVTNSVTLRANQKYDALHDDRDTLRRVMLRMVTTEGEKSARRRVPYSELNYVDKTENERVKTVIAHLVKARLIVNGEERGKPYVEPGHDVLVRSWDKLQEWQKEEQAILALQPQLTRRVLDWDDRPKSQSFLVKIEPVLNLCDKIIDFLKYLLWKLIKKEKSQIEEKNKRAFLWDDSPYLDQLNNKRQTDKYWFNKVETEFIRHSVWQRRRNTNLLRLIAITVMLGLSGLTIWALWNKQLSDLRAKAAESRNLISVKPIDALVLALEATNEWFPDQVFEVRSSLLSAVQTPKERDRLYLPTDSQACESEVETFLGNVVDSNKIKIICSEEWLQDWDKLNEPKEALPDKISQRHEDVVTSVAFSPDGKFIVSGSRDNSLRLWDINGNQIGEPLQGHESWVRWVAVSPDSRSVISLSNDRTIRLWDVSQENVIYSFPEKGIRKGGAGEDAKVALSKDGKVIFANKPDRENSEPGTLYQSIPAPGTSDLDYQEYPELVPLNDGTIIVNVGAEEEIAIADDGEISVGVETDERIILWDREGEPVDSETITSDRAFVTTTIAPDGNSIAVAVADYSDCPENKNVDNCVSVTTTIELWDVEENKLKQAQTVECENCKEIRAIALSKDGQFIASGSNDNIVRLWKRSGDLVHKFPKEHTLPIESIAFSHDGKWIASGSQDNKVMLWNTEKVRDEPLTLSGHRGWVSAIAFSSDDEFIATGSWDKTVRLWDIDGNPMGSPFKGHTQWISSVRFSSDDKSIISGSAYDSVRRWQAGNLKDWQKEACLQLRDHPVFEQRSFSFEQRSFSLEDVKRLLSSLVETFNSLRLRSLCNKISSSSSSEQTTILPTPTATSSNPSIVQPPVQNVPSPTSRSNNRQDKPSFPAPANAPTRPQNFPSPTPPSNNGQNSDEQAASDRRRARALNPTAVNAHINQALTYHRQGNYQQAISNYSKAIALNPNSAKAYSNRAAAYIEQRDYQRAIADSTKALNLISTYINAYINRGLAYYYQGDYEKAIADYTSALELDPYNYNAFHNRSLAYQRLAEVKEQRN